MPALDNFSFHAWLGLESGLRVLRLLGSRVWVSDSFQIFGEKEAMPYTMKKEGKLSGGEMSGGNVLHFSGHYYLDVCRSQSQSDLRSSSPVD